MNEIHEEKRTQEIDWDVDGPSPVSWPGSNFELVMDTRGFLAPQILVDKLSESEGNGSLWDVTTLERPTLENIYVIERPDSPWRVRARLACSGVHPDADYVDYALDFKCLVGTQTRGQYEEREVVRGNLSEIIRILSEELSGVDASFKDACTLKPDYRIVPSHELLDEAIQNVISSREVAAV